MKAASFEMTPERKERFLRVSREVLTVLLTECSPMEGIVILDGLITAIEEQQKIKIRQIVPIAKGQQDA